MTNMTRHMRWPAVLSATAILAAAATGCSTASLDADSSCKDFLKAPIEDQNEAVSSIAADTGAANAVTPLGRPNINYICANSPDKTLGYAVERTG